MWITFTRVPTVSGVGGGDKFEGAVRIEMMNIICDKHNSHMKMEILGDLTIYHAAKAKQLLLDGLNETPELNVDLSAVPEIDSAGLQLLLLLKREAGKQSKQLNFLAHSQSVVDLIQLFDLAAVFGDPLLLSSSSKFSSSKCD